LIWGKRKEREVVIYKGNWFWVFDLVSWKKVFEGRAIGQVMLGQCSGNFLSVFVVCAFHIPGSSRAVE
jgi:hypothetical protein